LVKARGKRGHEQNTNKELDGRFSRNGAKVKKTISKKKTRLQQSSVFLSVLREIVAFS
jgi:hypothetical protein